MVILQESFHLVDYVEPPVVQNLSQVGHVAHVHPVSWDKKSQHTRHT